MRYPKFRTFSEELDRQLKELKQEEINQIKYPKNTMTEITIEFGGGCLFATCKKCKHRIGAEEVRFPGTQEQQKEPRAKLEEARLKHTCVL